MPLVVKLFKISGSLGQEHVEQGQRITLTRSSFELRIPSNEGNAKLLSMVGFFPNSQLSLIVVFALEIILK